MGLSEEAEPGHGAERAAAGAGIVLQTLASSQFLMTLDSSVMNVSIATVAKDVGTTVTGIQTAITFYTLVMASLMITGGKLGQILGRKRAFAIGCVIYGCGSLITALAGNLAVLMLGWSVLEGVGAALIMPAVVALVASNFAPDQRPRAYGLVASAGAIAVAAGPLFGGLFTTYLSWRWAFVGEVLVVLIILGLTRRVANTPDGRRDRQGERNRPYRRTARITVGACCHRVDRTVLHPPDPHPATLSSTPRTRVIWRFYVCRGPTGGSSSYVDFAFAVMPSRVLPRQAMMLISPGVARKWRSFCV